MSAGFRIRTNEEIADLAYKFGTLLQTFFDRVEIRLFGSYQHNKPNAQSDLDFALVSKRLCRYRSLYIAKDFKQSKVGGRLHHRAHRSHS
jgi:predicted nucleotidyltransferase